MKFFPGALDEIENAPETRDHLDDLATTVRDRARNNARVISGARVSAIETEPGSDAQGPFADVGYTKTKPGFVLWWHEVGTSKHPATPHLRPALSRVG